MEAGGGVVVAGCYDYLHIGHGTTESYETVVKFPPDARRGLLDVEDIAADQKRIRAFAQCDLRQLVEDGGVFITAIVMLIEYLS